ncbi:hypothetical protein ACJZ2D_006405 [Fusarium nematophilum]
MWFSAADYVGASCILYPCIRCYAARIREGRLDESVVREVPLRQQPPIEPRTGTSKDSSDWQGVQTPCFVNDTLYTSFNMSKAADLAPDAVAGVQVHTIKDWTMDTDTSYANVTALVECIDELPETLVRAIQAEVRSTVNTSCVVPAQGSQLTCKNDGGYSQHLAELCSLGTASFESRRVSLEIRRYGKSAWTAELGFVEGETWEDRTMPNQPDYIPELPPPNSIQSQTANQPAEALTLQLPIQFPFTLLPIYAPSKA